MPKGGFGQTIGAANVKIMPETREFSGKLEKALEKIEKKVSFIVPLEIDESAFQRSVQQAISSAEKILELDIPATLEAEALTQQAQAAIEAAESTIKDLELETHLDSSGIVRQAQAAIGASEARIPEIDIPMDVPAGTAEKIAKNAKDVVDAAKTAAGKFDVEADIDKNGLGVRLREYLSEAGRNIRLSIPLDLDKDGLKEKVKAACLSARESVKVDIDVKSGLSGVIGGAQGAAASLASVATSGARVAAVLGGATAAVSGLASHAASLAAALGPAVAQVGALGAALGPTALGAGALSVATLKTAFEGFDDVLKAAEPAELEAALSKLTPAAQTFALSLQDLRDQFEDLGGYVQESFFANFDNFGDLAVLIDPLKTAMGDLAADFGQAAASVVEFLTQGTGFEAFSVLLENSSHVATRVAQAFASIFEGVVAAGAAASPIVAALSDRLAEIADGWSQRMIAGFQDGSLTEYFANALASVKQFWDFAKDLGGILSGVFSAMAASGGPVLGLLGAGADALNGWVNSAEGMSMLTKFFEQMSGAVSSVMPVIGTLAEIVLTTLAPAFASTVETLAPFANTLLNALKPALDSIAPLLPMVAESLGQAVTELAPLLPTIADAVVGILQAVSPLLPQLAQLVTDLLGPLIPILGLAIEGFAKIIEVLIPIAPAIAGFAAAIFIAANPILSLVIAIGVLVGALVKYWDEIVAWASGIGDTISDMCSRAGDAISGWVDSVKQWFSDMYDSTVNTVSGWWDNITSWFNTGVQGTLAVLSGWWDNIKGLFSGLFDTATGFAGRIWDAITSWFKDGVSNAISVFSNMGHILSDTGRKIWEILGNLFGGMWSDLQNATKNGVRGVIDFVGGIPGRVLNALGDLAELLFDSGVSLVQGFIDGIKRSIQRAMDAAADLVSAVRDYFPFSPAKRGAFSGRGWVLYSGRAIGESFAQGITDTANKAANAAKSTASRVGAAFQDGVSDSLERVRYFDTVGVKGALESLFDEISAAWEGGDAGGASLNAFLGRDGGDRAFWALRRAGTRARSILEDISDAYDELQVAFDGGDWGYATLKRYLGEDAASVLTDVAAKAGETTRAVRYSFDEMKNAYDELQVAFDGGDWGYATLKRYLGEDAASVLTDFAAKTGETFRSVQHAISEHVQEVERASKPYVDAFQGAIQQVKAQADEAAAPMISSGRAVGEAFAYGIAQSRAQIENAANAAADAARAYFPFSPAKKGPFSGRGWVLHSGHAVGEAFAQGITDTVADAAAAAGELSAAAHRNIDVAKTSASNASAHSDHGNGRAGSDYSIHVGTVVAADPDAPLQEIERMQRAAQIRGGT